MPIRTLIVDDEPLARLNLSSLLEPEPDFDIVGECADADAALRAFHSARPQLVFLDVQMPGLDGFEMLARAPAPPAIVFVTAHEQFALRAFDASAVDYLLKPFRRERFRQALERVRERLRPSAADAPERMLVKSGGRYLFVAFDELDFVRAAANYVSLHTGKATHAVRETMADLEQRLPPGRFLRVHRSYIVNVAALAALEPAGNGEFVARLRSGRELPIGPSYLAPIREHLAAAPLLRLGAAGLV